MEAKRLVFTAKRTCEVETFELADTPDGKQILVETITSLISPGTELSIFNESHSGFQDPSNTFAQYPHEPGYATCGKVMRVGPDVTAIKAGDTVLTRGMHASHQLDEEDNALVCPANVSVDHAPFSVLGSISLNGARHAGISLGAATAVVGQGLIGLFALHFAKSAGAHPLIGVDLSDRRLELSKHMGADAVLNPNNQDVIAGVKELTEGKMLTRVIESTGVSSQIPLLMDLLSKGGVLFLLGGAHGKVEVDFYSAVIKKNLTIIGGHESGAAVCEDYHFPWTNRANMAHCLDLISKGKLDVAPLITDRVTPDAAAQAYVMSEQEPDKHLGILIQWQ